MILEFAIQNFKSFKDLQVFSLEASKEEDDNDNIIRLVKLEGDYRVLKTKAIYGANASGKSNLILGLVAMWKIMNDNLKYDYIDMYENFISPYRLDAEFLNQPSYFQIIFTHEGNRYRYGFELGRQKIHKEWLYLKKKKEVVLFEREGVKLIELNEASFKEGKIIQQGIKMFNERTLVISVLDQLSSDISSIVKECINSKIIINPNHSGSWPKKHTIDSFEKDYEFQKWTVQLLSEIDDSISNAKIQEINLPNGIIDKIPIILRKIDNQDISFILEMEEAAGTIKIFNISRIIYLSIYKGKTLVIDELDALLHPKLTRKIIELFQSPDAHKDAQLIFATHDTNLMDSELLRRDQITFLEKSSEGHSEIFDLSDIKGVRANDLFEKNYLKGNYGALPILNNLEKILFHG